MHIRKARHGLHTTASALQLQCNKRLAHVRQQMLALVYRRIRDRDPAATSGQNNGNICAHRACPDNHCVRVARMRG
jgi:hypothetical protein